MVKQNVKTTNTGNANTGVSLPKTTAPVQVVTGSNPKHTAGLTVQNKGKTPTSFLPVNNDDVVQGDLYTGQKPNLPAELPVQPPVNNSGYSAPAGSSANTGSNVKENLPVLPSDDIFTPVEDTERYPSNNSNAGSSTNTGGNVKENLPALPSDPGKYTPVEATGSTATPSTTYDPNVDYQALINEAVKNGDYESAAYYEILRNQKIRDMNASGTNKWNAEETDLYSSYLPNAGSSTNTGGNVKENLPSLPSDDIFTPVEDTERYPSNNTNPGSSTNTGSNVKENLPVLPGTGNFTPVEATGPSPITGTKPSGAATLPVETPANKPSNSSTGSTATNPSSGNLGSNTNPGTPTDSNNSSQTPTDTSAEDKYGKDYIQSLIESIIGQPSDTADNSKYGEEFIQSLIESLGGQSGGSTTPGSVGAEDPLDGVLGQLLNKYNGGSGGNINVDLGGLYAGSSINPLDKLSTDQLKAMLDAEKAAAEKQANGQIDYATQQAVTELERAMQDAQPQFKTQAESVDLNARQSMDNAALYAELRGDKGGIGAEQYNSIQNAAAQNRLSVQQAQTKLSTDTARQIEDLRAKGEFEKADKALELTQNYLSKLMSLEQWAQEYNMSVDQFNAQLGQWQQEYQMALKQLEISNEKWEQEFGFSQDQFAASLDQWLKDYQFNQDQADISNSQWQQEYNAALQQWAQEFAHEKNQADIGNSQWQQEFNAALQQWAQEFDLAKNKSAEQEQQHSAGYDDVASVAKKKGSADLTDKYLGNMVDSGYITLEEADWIFRVVCGYSYSQLPGVKYGLDEETNLNVKADPIHYGSGAYTPVQIS